MMNIMDKLQVTDHLVKSQILVAGLASGLPGIVPKFTKNADSVPPGIIIIIKDDENVLYLWCATRDKTFSYICS